MPLQKINSRNGILYDLILSLSGFLQTVIIYTLIFIEIINNRSDFYRILEEYYSTHFPDTLF